MRQLLDGEGLLDDLPPVAFQVLHGLAVEAVAAPPQRLLRYSSFHFFKSTMKFVDVAVFFDVPLLCKPLCGFLYQFFVEFELIRKDRVYVHLLRSIKDFYSDYSILGGRI